jgi:hypothetical protein
MPERSAYSAQLPPFLRATSQCGAPGRQIEISVSTQFAAMRNAALIRLSWDSCRMSPESPKIAAPFISFLQHCLSWTQSMARRRVNIAVACFTLFSAIRKNFPAFSQGAWHDFQQRLRTGEIVNIDARHGRT